MAKLAALSRQRSLELLASVPYGRVVFSQRALPAIRSQHIRVAGPTTGPRGPLRSVHS
jgi:hypothetical protein